MPPPDRVFGVVTVTGHRPQHLDGDFSLASPLWRWLAARIDLVLAQATHLRCGMAIGVDLLAAERAHLLGVPFTAYVPFDGQASKWPQASQARYGQALVRASERALVNEGGYATWKLHARNERMLTPAPDTLVAVWDGRESGGTYRTVRRARELGVAVHHIDPGQAPSR